MRSLIRHPIRTSIAAALVVAATACGSDAPLSPVSQTLDLASIVAQLAGGFSTVPTADAGPSVPRPNLVPASCVYSSTSQNFVCPPVTTSGLTFTGTYWLYDAAGHAQSQPDVATTASVRVVTDTKGTLALAALDTGGVVGVTGHSDMTMSGLLTTRRVLNGTTTAHDDLTRQGSSVHFVTDVATVTKDVVTPTDALSHWPTSGTHTVDATNTESDRPGFSLKSHAVITFNGSNIVTITTSLNGEIQLNCKVDLSGKTAPVCS